MEDKKFFNINKFLIDLSPKCGSSSLLKSFIVYYKPKFKIHNNLSDKYENSIHFYKNNNMCTHDNNDKILIKLIRNPYTRIISAFIHNCIKIDISFITYLKKIKDFLLFNIKDNNLFSDERFNRHFYFLNDSDYEFNHIIKIENLSDDLDKLNNIYNINLKYNKINNRKKACNKNNNINYIYDSIIKYKYNIPNDYSVFYNNESKNLVNEIYKKDLDKFKYSYPFNNL